MKNNLSLMGLLCSVGIFCLFPFSYSQESTSENSMIYPSFGLGIGFFYPSDVNEYIVDYVLSGYYFDNPEIYEYLEVNAGLTLRLPKADLGVSAVYDMAPKINVILDGESITYAYNRISPEVFADYFIGNKTGKHAMFIGAGINYSFLWFKQFKASAPGFKLQAGYSFQFKKFNLQPYGAFRCTKAVSESHQVAETEWEKLELTYTGFQIGVQMSFHQRMLYK